MAINYGTSLGGRGYKSGTGRAYPPATRPAEDVGVKRPTVRHSGIGALINENLRKQQAFKDRHETVPASFEREYESLLTALKQGEAAEDVSEFAEDGGSRDEAP